MFDLGWSELLVIGVVALIAIGPKELPGVLRALGQWVTKIRGMASEFQGQFQEAMREAEMADLKKEVDNLKSNFETPFDPAKDLDSNWSPDKPASSAVATAPPAGDDTATVGAEPSTPAQEASIPEPVIPEPTIPEPTIPEPVMPEPVEPAAVEAPPPAAGEPPPQINDGSRP